MAMDKKYKVLQNGTDIRGIALDGVKGEDVNLTPEIIQNIGIGFVKWLANKKNKQFNELKIAIGHDSRVTAKMLFENVSKGILTLGSKIYYSGLSSTPAMFMSTIIDDFKFDGAIMLTASHLPYNRNGLKFFTNSGALEKSDITEILEYASSANESIITEISYENIDLMTKYSEIFVNKLRKEINYKDDYEKPLKKFKIVVDAGNGAGGFFVEKILKPLGADTDGSQFLEPDGYFPNHIPNPEDSEAMEYIKKAVLDNKADFGIIFDTDVDRAAVVDSNGNIINRNDLIAMISAIILEEHPKTVIVTDSITSDGLTEFIENVLNGIHHRFKRGYKNVINEAKRYNELGKECHLAIETSGHAAIKENYFLDDGAYLVAKILIKMAKMKLYENKNISELIKDLKRPQESKEIRIKINTEDFADYGKQIISDLEKFAKNKENWQIVEPNYEGIRVKCNRSNENGWFLLRLSLHDPVLPINIESNIKDGVSNIEKELFIFLKKYDKLSI